MSGTQLPSKPHTMHPCYLLLPLACTSLRHVSSNTALLSMQVYSSAGSVYMLKTSQVLCKLVMHGSNLL